MNMDMKKKMDMEMDMKMDMEAETGEKKRGRRDMMMMHHGPAMWVAPGKNRCGSTA
jgi:hypothetical protein